MFCNVGVAEKISFLDIKLGDKITDHFTSNQINKHYMDDDEHTKTLKGERVYGRDLISVSYTHLTLPTTPYV